MAAICVIPARGGSKGIPNKNITLLNGKPLIAHTIEAAIESGVFSHIFVNTDCLKIVDKCKSISENIHIYHRDPHLGTDESTILSVLQDFVRNTGLDHTIDTLTLLQPTSPLRTADDIKNAHRLWAESRAQTLVSIVKVPHNMNPNSVYSCDSHSLKLVHPSPSTETQRQQKSVFYARNGPAILIMRVANIISGCLYVPPLIGYEMDWLRSFDIDYPEDLTLIEKLMS